MNIKSMIKEKAKDIGFDLVGVTDLSPSKYKKEYENWLLKGMHADMDYLVKTKMIRLSPLLRYRWAKSILMVGMNYYPGQPLNSKKDKILISRYATGRDYHVVLNEKLFELSNFIISTTGVRQTKYYTDTGPLLEKELAQRAGLGWIGKNTILITEEFGSWIFLGEILLDIEVEPDEPGKDRCEDCDLCSKYCPSQALIPSYILNNNLCTAFHTVMNKGKLPDWFPSSGNPYIFGCDICQEVCPFNRDVKRTKISDFLPREKLVNPDIQWLSGLKEEEFKHNFKNTPVEWSGFDIFMRNVNAFLKKKHEYI